MKLIIYELNEIPRKLFDLYVNKFPNSSFAEIANKGIVLNTITKDIGELHPWSTWPTVHRGVYTDAYKIFQLIKIYLIRKFINLYGKFKEEILI